MKYWLMKSEPDVYSIDHLAQDHQTWWEGVRNYQARNFMMKEMAVGDLVLFYHSNANPSGIAGLGKVSKAAAPDQSQFNKTSDNTSDKIPDTFDAKATLEKPIWFCVQIEFQEKFKQVLSLQELKTEKALKEMLVVQQGQRLSVQPVSEKHFRKILQMAEKK